MNTSKTPVQVTQELLALVNERHERTEAGRENKSDPATDPLIRSLLDELSLSGDGTLASIDRTDLYFEIDHHDPELFRQALVRLQDEASEMPESLQKIFSKLLS